MTHQRLIIALVLLAIVFSIDAFLGYNPTESSQAQGVSFPKYALYSEESLQSVQGNGGHAVLYFWSSSCGNCSFLDEELKLINGKLPNGVTVFNVDFDTQNDLVEKYSAEVDMFIQIDKDGIELKRWSGGNVGKINKEALLLP